MHQCRESHRRAVISCAQGLRSHQVEGVVHVRAVPYCWPRLLIATLAVWLRAGPMKTPGPRWSSSRLCASRGYFDLASDYLEKLREEKSTPQEFRTVIDYEFGRLLIDEASKTGDLVRRKELLEQARSRLETFTKGQPNHELASEALVQLARLLVERGHLAVLLGEESEDKAEKNAKLVEARDVVRPGPRCLHQGGRTAHRRVQGVSQLRPRRRPAEAESANAATPP